MDLPIHIGSIIGFKIGDGSCGRNTVHSITKMICGCVGLPTDLRSIQNDVGGLCRGSLTA
ncbi:hypothetical protein [Leptospira sp. mild_001]|uniref:hypothetical protein n=1 Tax=Leptospira sp. mild_001 TaxID=2838238 RepID=UPI001E405118|nr:hypothetical protein [Leptospira sp. mild_001]